MITMSCQIGWRGKEDAVRFVAKWIGMKPALEWRGGRKRRGWPLGQPL